VGLFTREPKVVKRVLDVFEEDWAKTQAGQKEIKVSEKEPALAEAG
jgi:hypothetical protein